MKPNHPRKTTALFSALAMALVATTSVRAQQASPTDQDDSTPSAKNNTIILSPFEVTADNDLGYGVKSTTGASRVAMDYIDVPQTVNVVTAQFITDFNIQDNRTLLQFVPNISQSQGQYLVVRGIPTDATYIDGVSIGNNRTVMPFQFYDRVEVIKGPSSAAFGLGEPAGLINYVSKTPSGGEKSTFTVGVGDYKNSFFNFDTEGRSAKYKNISYRLVTYAEKGNQPVLSQGQHSGAGAHLALRDDINKTTDVQLLVSYAQTKGMAVTDVAGYFKSQTGIDLLATVGLPKLPKVLDKDADLIPRGWGNSVYATNFGIKLVANKQLFDSKVNFRNQVSYDNSTEPDRFWGAIDNIFNPSPGVYTTGINRYHFRANNNAVTENFDFDGHFELKGIKLHALMGGLARANSGRNEADGPPGLNADGTRATVNIYNPDLTPIIVPTSPITDTFGNVNQPLLHYWNNRSKNIQYGGYAQLEATFWKDRITAMAGWRKDKFHTYVHTGLNNLTTSPDWQTTKGSPRYAITLKPWKWFSVYGLVTEHRDPTLYRQKYVLVQEGSITQETRDKYHNFQDLIGYEPGGKLKEVGMKFSLLKDKVTVSACYFDETAGNTTVPSGITIVNSDGSLTVISDYHIVDKKIHGIEMELFGQPTKRLSFIANYGMAKGRDAGSTAAAPQFIGPPTTFSAHAKYDFGDLHGKGLYATFGGIHYGSYWLSGNYPYLIRWTSSQYSLDGGIGYKWDKGRQSLYFQVKNFTDQYNTLGDVAQYDAGPREQAFLTYTKTF